MLFATVLVLFLVTWMPVLSLRWHNPPTTAFMLETALGSAHGQPLHQTWVPYERIAPAMRLAVVASEDQTFPTNHGFDLRAIRKAIKHNEQGDTVHGASTITQQTAKNLFLWSGGGYFRKAIGAYFTVLIDVTWPKRRVLDMYLNIAQFGPHTFGVEAAAETYFGKHASQLNQAEAALLAAALPDPDHFDPTDPSEYILQRQTWILDQMQQLGSNYLAGISN
ncbi:MAG: monofunctional biosynthetic peptidoglycan transglycosylase [Gammaproteobacteria bacterium]